MWNQDFRAGQGWGLFIQEAMGLWLHEVKEWEGKEEAPRSGSQDPQRSLGGAVRGRRNIRVSWARGQAVWVLQWL